MKERINEILSSLIESTDNGNLEWEVDVDSKYKRELKSKSEDEQTEFSMSIEYRLSGDKFKLTDPSLFFKNKSLPNGNYYVSSYEYKEKLDELTKSLLKKYCKDLKPNIKEVEDTLDSINKGISKSTYRDSRLNKILNYISGSK